MQVLALKHKRLETKAWYFDSIITNSGNIIFTTDVDHRILKFNQGSEKTFGLTQTDVLGREVFSLFPDPVLIENLLKQVEAAGYAETQEILIKHSVTGEETWLSMSLTCMLNRDRETIGEVFNCSNITWRKHLEQELQVKNDQLLRLSITDGLTGLFNIRHLNNELMKLIKANRRYPNRSLSLVLLDVDKFKEYNDTKGHQAGDNLLVCLSGILNGEIRQDMDSAYRYGGDEFVLLLPDTTGEGARSICERILAAFDKLNPIPCSLSLGIAQYQQGDEGRDLHQVIKEFIGRADETMYAVKCRGGKGIKLHSDSLNPTAPIGSIVDENKFT